MTITKEQIAQVKEALGPLHEWANACHAASLTIVRAGIFPEARVARGICKGVGSQHSWVVVGNDCYDDSASIIDPTLWSQSEEWHINLGTKIWIGSYSDGLHRPKGKGNIFAWGRPPAAIEEPVELTPRKPWSKEAQGFLKLLGPLDSEGWIQLAHAPMEGWPSGEIIDAMCESGFDGFIPIDIEGMVTDRNPNGLYLREEGS